MEKNIYLTFDGAPHPPGTTNILEVLEKLNVKATFFMEGERVDSLPKCAKKVYQKGHDIGNHSYTHSDFTKLDLGECIKEVKKTEKAIINNVGVKPIFFRPPNGDIEDKIAEKIIILGYKIVLWTYSIKDWEGPDAKNLSERVMNKLNSKNIIVFHDKIEWNPETLEIIIPRAREKGYKFKKISNHKDLENRDVIS